MRHSTRHVIGVLAVVAFGAMGCNRKEAPPPPPETTATPAEAPPTERVVGPLSQSRRRRPGDDERPAQGLRRAPREAGKRAAQAARRATPEQIDKNQRAFEQRMRRPARGAKQGDIFTPEAQVVIKRLLATVFGGPDGKQLKASIMDENPVEREAHRQRPLPGRRPDLDHAPAGAADAARS